MKTNANVSAKMQGNTHNSLAVLKKVSVNPELHPAMVISKKPASKLSIRGYQLRQWLEHLNGSQGLYFLDIAKDNNKYSLHFKDHPSSKLMELEYNEPKAGEETKKEWLEALLFDLALFPDTPILTMDSNHVEGILVEMALIYFEHAKAIDNVISRLVNVDVKQVIEMGIYQDSRIKELSVDGIYHALYPGTSRSFKEQASYGLYLIYIAMESIFYQVLGKRTMA